MVRATTHLPTSTWLSAPGWALMASVSFTAVNVSTPPRAVRASVRRDRYTSLPSRSALPAGRHASIAARPAKVSAKRKVEGMSPKAGSNQRRMPASHEKAVAPKKPCAISVRNCWFSR